MNIERLFGMVVRQVMRRLVTKGVNAGIDLATKRRGAPGASDDREQKAAGRESVRRAQQAIRLGRKIGRF